MAGLNYWQKKARAIKFGKAEDRPQDEMKKFMLYRRRINFMEILPECSFDVKNIIKAWVPLDHEMPENFVRTISMDNKDNFIFVQDDQQFDDMLMKLRTAKVLALDFEYHDDHSYLGKSV
ncbi:unnamed protein product [Allacma fusca]|uniref:Uncharacterized protein n=1 Tax=Allacma fusca TaxID=39272 RepID=A0A8J2LRE9_9HEXA|nr:unnamed protein product [Allacma fusca]